MEKPSEALQQPETVNSVNEATARLLGSLGIIDALSEEYAGATSPEHDTDSMWIVRGTE